MMNRPLLAAIAVLFSLPACRENEPARSAVEKLAQQVPAEGEVIVTFHVEEPPGPPGLADPPVYVRANEVRTEDDEPGVREFFASLKIPDEADRWPGVRFEAGMVGPFRSASFSDPTPSQFEHWDRKIAVGLLHDRIDAMTGRSRGPR